MMAEGIRVQTGVDLSLKDEIKRSLQAYGYRDGDVVEVRALRYGATGGKKSTASGFFNNLDALAEVIARNEGKGGGWYITKNDLKPEVIHRRYNRFEAFAQADELTKNDLVTRRRRLLIDIDPDRISGIASTEGQYQAAIEKAKNVRQWFRDNEWPEPALVSTGNGAALLFLIDLPVDDDKLEEKIIAVTRMLFSDLDEEEILDHNMIRDEPEKIRVDIDPSVTDLARIIRIPGTTNRKGDPSPDRPHRRAVILEAPQKLDVVPREKMEEMASLHGQLYPPQEGKGPVRTKARRHTRINVGKLADALGLTEAYNKKMGGGTAHIYTSCPRDSSHKKSFMIIERDDGGASAHCFHKSCGHNKDFLNDLLTDSMREACIERIDEPHLNHPMTMRVVEKLGVPVVEGKNYDKVVPDAAKLSELLVSNHDFFTDQDKELYALVKDGQVKRVMPVDSIQFQSHASNMFLKEFGKPPGQQTIKNAILPLYERTTDVRHLKLRTNGENMADDGKRTIYYDLGDETYDMVKITKAGYEVVPSDDVRFYRSSTMLPQSRPCPPAQADIQALFKHLNINIYLGDVEAEKDAAGNILRQAEYKAALEENERDIEDVKLLIATVVIYNMVPDTPDYTIGRVGLNINGEKGSGKTELMWLLKHIIDPMVVGYNNMPDNKGDLIQALISSAVVAVDNISAITEELSDLLCGAANPRGTMVQKRRLFTNKDLVSITIKRFVMMTGINSVIRKTDLADRFIFLDLQRIDEKTRCSVVDMNADLDPDMPVIMGGCFKVLSDAMKIYPAYMPMEKSRMPDFDRWGYCIAEAIDPGHGGERFKRIYKKLQVERDVGMLSEGLVSQAILSIMERGGEIHSQTLSGLQASLRQELVDNHGSTRLMLDRDFPNHRGEFLKELQSIKSNLEAAGYELKIKKKHRSDDDKSTSKLFVSVTRKR